MTNVVKIHQPDSPYRQSVHTEADEYVVVAMMSGSALHALTKPKTNEEAASLSQLTTEMFMAADRSTVERRCIGARLPGPVHLVADGHPEAERDLVFRLQPRSVITQTVRFRNLGRAKPRIVLDDLFADE